MTSCTYQGSGSQKARDFVNMFCALPKSWRCFQQNGKLVKGKGRYLLDNKHTPYADETTPTFWPRCTTKGLRIDVVLCFSMFQHGELIHWVVGLGTRGMLTWFCATFLFLFFWVGHIFHFPSLNLLSKRSRLIYAVRVGVFCFSFLGFPQRISLQLPCGCP